MSRPIPTPENLYEGKHLRLIRRGHWEYAERTNASGGVAVIAITPENKLILVEQFRPPVRRSVVELPAGLAGDILGEESEAMAAAAQRELREETGYQAHRMIHLLTGPTSAGMTSEIITIFRAIGVKRVGKGGGDEHEEITVHEISVAEADHWLRNKIAQGVLIDPKVYVGLYFAKISDQEFDP